MSWKHLRPFPCIICLLLSRGKPCANGAEGCSSWAGSLVSALHRAWGYEHPPDSATGDYFVVRIL